MSAVLQATKKGSRQRLSMILFAGRAAISGAVKRPAIEIARISPRLSSPQVARA
jgi:hypothetical protein